MHCLSAGRVALLLLICGCNYSTIRIPPGTSRAKVRMAITKALESEGYKNTAVLPTQREKKEDPYFAIQTTSHYCMTCGVWNGIWGFPLYWYHHTVYASDDSVKIQNNGYGWCIWLGVSSMLIPIYSSGGLYEAIERELQASAARSKPSSSRPRSDAVP